MVPGLVSSRELLVNCLSAERKKWANGRYIIKWACLGQIRHDSLRWRTWGGLSLWRHYSEACRSGRLRRDYQLSRNRRGWHLQPCLLVSENSQTYWNGLLGLDRYWPQQWRCCGFRGLWRLPAGKKLFFLNRFLSVGSARYDRWKTLQPLGGLVEKCMSHRRLLGIQHPLA